MTATYGTCAMQMPSSYVMVDAEEMEYLEGGGWIAWTFAVVAGAASSVVGALAGIAAGAAVGTVTLPIIGTVSLALVGGVTGAIAAYSAGFMSGYEFGRLLEKKFFGWY